MKTILREYRAFAGEAFHEIWGHAIKAVGETIQASLFFVTLAVMIIFSPAVVGFAYYSRKRRGVR